MFNALILPSIIYILPIIFLSIIAGAGLKVKFWHILIAIGLGIISFFPVQLVDEFIVRKFIPHYYPTRIAFVSWVICAEIIKGALLFLLPGKNTSAKSFLFASMIAGLTFGCLQSIVEYMNQYAIATSMNAQLMWWPLIFKLICIDIINMCCTAIAGLFVYSCKIKKPRWILIAYPIILRALFEFFNVKLEIKWFTIAVLLLALIECRIKYKSMTEEDE